MILRLITEHADLCEISASRLIKGIDCNFDFIDKLVVVPEKNKHDNDLLLEQAHASFKAEWKLEITDSIKPSASTIVALNSVNGWEKTYETLDCKDHNPFGIDKHGRVFPMGRNFGKLEYPNMNKQLFSSLHTGNPHASLYFFPSGFYSVYTGMGPINEDGFRISHDLAKLRERDKKHLIVTVFGGSCVWSQYCFHEETFCFQLEKLLNEHSGGEFVFSVLNFGCFGHLVHDQINAFLTFAEFLNPEIVIFHDGWNDLANGMLSDPFLLSRYGHTYNVLLENWGMELQNTKVESSTAKVLSPTKMNSRKLAVDAYVKKKIQVSKILKGANTFPIHGLQPCLFSRDSLHPFERKQTEIGAKEDQNLSRFHTQLLPALMKNAGERIMADGILENFIDLNTIFSSLEEGLFFGDFVHTYPDGDTEIAKTYFNHIAKRFLT